MRDRIGRIAGVVALVAWTTLILMLFSEGGTC